MVRAFLERAKETLTDEYMGPFLTAVKELVRTLRKGEYTADDVDAVRAVCAMRMVVVTCRDRTSDLS